MSAKRYDLEQQEQIARMSIEGGKSGNQIAAELGISKNSVYKWISQYKKRKSIRNMVSGTTVRQLLTWNNPHGNIWILYYWGDFFLWGDHGEKSIREEYIMLLLEGITRNIFSKKALIRDTL